jgi:hypothetical protein
MMVADGKYAAAVGTALLLAAGCLGGGIVYNGSFEADGPVQDILAEPPYMWCEVDFQSADFGGQVRDTWFEHGDHSLALFSESLGSFSAGDSALISQDLNLDGATLLANLRLSSSDSLSPWTAERRTAFVMIDDSVVWDSDGVELDPDGSYSGQIEIDVSGYDDQLHVVSLGIRVNAEEDLFSFQPRYTVEWDLVRLDSYCGGFGYLPEDINLDCYVDLLDYSALAGWWLEFTEDRPDIVADGFVDEHDLTALVEAWLDCTDAGLRSCLEVDLPAVDINTDGIVDYADLSELVAVWLAEDDCSLADLNGDGRVNLDDYAVLLQDWGLTNWLYGLN